MEFQKIGVFWGGEGLYFIMFVRKPVSGGRKKMRKKKLEKKLIVNHNYGIKR